MLTFNIIPRPNGIFLDQNNIPTRYITKGSSSVMNSLVSSSVTAASLNCNSMNKSCQGVAFSKTLNKNFTVYLHPDTFFGEYSDYLAFSTFVDWVGGFYRSINPQQGCAFEPLVDNYLNWPTSAPRLCGLTLNRKWNSTLATGDLDTSVYINGKLVESFPFGSYQLDV